VFSPQEQFNQVPSPLIQDWFRAWMEQWGLPAELRLDNGSPWGGAFDLPTVFALWLIGLGLRLHFNPACQPQQNGVIERNNGLGQRWAEVRQCHSAAEVQAKLEEVDEVQRAYMPSVAGRSRLAAYPGLRHSGRSYSREWEEASWSLAAVESVLEGIVAKRRVGGTGQITLYYRRVYVGREQAGREVRVQYDKGSHMWVVIGADGRGLRAVPAVEVDREKIMTLTMYEEPKAKKRRRDARRRARPAATP
jgi:hypothetical protein